MAFFRRMAPARTMMESMHSRMVPTLNRGSFFCTIMERAVVPASVPPTRSIKPAPTPMTRPAILAMTRWFSSGTAGK